MVNAFGPAGFELDDWAVYLVDGQGCHFSIVEWHNCRLRPRPIWAEARILGEALVGLPCLGNDCL